MNLFVTNQNRWSYGEELRPGRDWRAILGIAALVIVASAAWNVVIYLEIATGVSLGSAPESTLPAVSSTEVKDVRAVFTSRTIEQSKYENGTYSFIDPSL